MESKYCRAFFTELTNSSKLSSATATVAVPHGRDRERDHETDLLQIVVPIRFPSPLGSHSVQTSSKLDLNGASEIAPRRIHQDIRRGSWASYVLERIDNNNERLSREVKLKMGCAVAFATTVHVRLSRKWHRSHCVRRLDKVTCSAANTVPDRAVAKIAEEEESLYCYVACSPLRSDYLEKILTAKVYDVAIESSLEAAPLLSQRLGHRVLLKREDTQPVFSFKLRGAYNCMAKAPRETLQNGVIAASAGNHAQGVALGARTLGVDATIVMPVVTPQIKVDAVRRLGAQAILYGNNFDAAKGHALKLSETSGMLFVPPFDDADVIAGQGTIGLEIVRQYSDAIDAVFVPIGGGGLIAGIALVLKRLRPETKIIGVEPCDADAMKRSLEAGKRVTLSRCGTFADGVAVIEVGEETFRICKELVDDVLLVDTDEICAAIKDTFEETRSILEPAGALSVAGVKKYAELNETKNKTYVAVTSGANTNFDRLRYVSERAEIGERREAVFAVTIPERPGAFKDLISTLSERNISEFNYRYADRDKANVFVGVTVRNRTEALQVFESLSLKFVTVDLTDNEVAKIHLRHLVGGKANVHDEVLYRFEFPERPGALMRFLQTLRFTWNITLFHYRNHGTDTGRVLAGISVPHDERADLQDFLNSLGPGYFWWNENDNIAYKIFLGEQESSHHRTHS